MTRNVHIATLLTCHNRRAKTLECLRTLDSQELPAGVQLDVIMVDDGSTDGTSAAVREAFPRTTLLRGDGSLYWSGGMRRAFAHALEQGYDFYLWVNDDTFLTPSALASLLEAFDAIAEERAIVVGSVKDPESEQLTYGGLVRGSRWHPLKYRCLPPSSRPQPCDVMNGNCVLIPHAAAAVTGNIDVRFTHSIGDLDYAMRARQAGCSIWVAPGYVGTCSRNAVQGSWEDTTLPLRTRWNKMRGPKGLPPAEWMLYARRYAGVLWPFYGTLPRLRLLLSTPLKR